MSNQTEQEKADYLMDLFGDINQCIKFCNDMIYVLVSQQRKSFYQRVKQILIDKQK